MNVSDALRARTSIRAFLDRPVANDLLSELLESANYSASGGNLQPWRIYVLNGPVMPRFLAHLSAQTEPEEPAYDVYPPKLKEPYRSSRFKCGEDMYELLGIPREDRPARLKHLERNFKFFDAPAALFCFVDRVMGPPQWSDLGMFLQSFMLAAQEAGLSTCAQECWATRPRAVTEFVQAPPELTLFCGMAVGYADPDAAVNRLRTDREPLERWAAFVT